ncbi:GMC oxidoreductase [Aquabacterium humicola]|uniref:GMC oxidoreductase n=1 Tax=Aquabacterium humicola TaxID=3237377 RepID=UPI002543B243|nr:GMC family oxidoreductase [Rubrivivax pictus]
MASEEYDVVIIGSGVGGGAVAHQLAGSAARVLVLERGTELPHEPQNRDAEAVFCEHRYRTTETWTSGARRFRPGQFYFVGGHTSFYGAAMFRLRERDFEATEHEDGLSPAWPIDYAALEPWYAVAERLFGVHGAAGLDPCEPWRSAPYPHGPVPHEPVIAEIEQRLRRRGLQPFPMPIAIDLHEGGRCERCSTCDAFPCLVDAKGDARTRLLAPALRQANVTLRTQALVTRLVTDSSGRRIVAAEVVRHGERQKVRGRHFVLAAGAINSAALLLRSATGAFPQGLANRSGTVGRHFMNHNCTALMAIDPARRNETRLPKTLALNDWYFGDAARGEPPLGHLQLLGKVGEPMLRGAMPRWVPRAAREWLAAHSVDWYAMSEDLPHADSRVGLNSDGSIDLQWRRTNQRTHRRLVAKACGLMRRIGYPLVFGKPFGLESPSHQCGTVRFGNDPAQSALDPWCRAWDHDNLHVVDASFFPSSGAVNPALTVAAQALRVGHHLRGEELQ